MRHLLPFLLFLLSINLCAQAWQWTRHIGGPGEDGVGLGAVDENGDLYVLAGYAYNNGNGPYNNCYINGDTVLGRADSFIAKYAPDGTLLWLRNCNSSTNGTLGFSDLAIDTAERALYLVGSYQFNCVLDTCSLSTPFSAGFLSKWTYDGSCLWARNIATCPQDLVGSTCGLSTVAFDPAGRVIAGGTGAPYWPTMVEGVPFPPASYIVACDLDGAPLWSRVLAERTGTSKLLQPLAMSVQVEQVFIHGHLLLSNALDTLAVDTFQLTGHQGGGYTLLSMSAVDGSVQWLRFDALAALAGTVIPRRMGMDTLGNIHVMGNYVDMAVFDTDTLSSTSGMGRGYLASYNLQGNLTSLREFDASGNVSFRSLDVTAEGWVSVIGSVAGTGEWDGVPFSTTAPREMFISKHTPAGTCVDLMHEGELTGSSIVTSSSGHYVVGHFPMLGSPTGTVSLGNDTYTSHGYQDAVLAKHDLLTGIIAPKNAPAERLLIYPNPSNGTFRVVVPDAMAYDPQLVLRVFDATGRLVREQRMDMGEQRPRMEVEGVGRGYYMVTLGNGYRMYSGSMVVE